jgi:FkbM family methyltransferase
MNIIQIGCNNGDDHVYNYIVNNQDKIDNVYLIDANSNCIEVSKVQYKDISNVTYLHYAITFSDEEYVELCVPDNGDSISIHSSLLESHMLSHGHPNFKKERVPAKNINKLFEELNIQCLDRLYIDTEGLDIDIVNSLDFSKIDIKFLMFEYIHSDGSHSYGGERLDKLSAHLESLGYRLSKEEFNVIAEK